jgi:hypothetical protein
MPNEAILRTATANLLPAQVLDGVLAFVRGTFPALTNTFFTTPTDIGNYGAVTAEADGIIRAAEAQTAAIAHFSNQWKEYVFDTAASGDVDAISKTIERVFETVVQFGPQSIDLRNLSADQVNGEHLAASLRATFVWRENVPGWQDARAVAAAALQRVGINPADALLGLM